MSRQDFSLEFAEGPGKEPQGEVDCQCVTGEVGLGDCRENKTAQDPDIAGNRKCPTLNEVSALSRELPENKTRKSET